MFSAYMKFEQLPDAIKEKHKIKVGAKIPRFDLTEFAGYYRPIESLKNKKGQVVLYLTETRGIIDSSDQRRADRFLMGKDSLNFSSVYLFDGESTNIVGYGTPNAEKTFSAKKLPNPFFEHRDDGFLFAISEDWRAIEVLVLPKGKNTILGNAKALMDGVYNDAIKTIRQAATVFFKY